MDRIYKESNKAETETTMNILYSENILSIYTNKVNLKKQLYKILGEPTQQYMKKRSIVASRWDISLKEKSKISQIILKADLFEIME